MLLGRCDKRALCMKKKATDNTFCKYSKKVGIAASSGHLLIENKFHTR